MKSSEQSSATHEDDAQGGSHQDDSAAADDLTSLADLLAVDDQADDDDDTSGDDKAQSGGSREKTKPTKFNDLAGATDLDLDALYKLEINLDDDSEPVTIEALKDSYKQRSDFEVEKIAFEEARSQSEAELLRAKSELNDILQALPKNAVSKDLLQKIRDKHDKQMNAERAKTLEAIVSWRDEGKRTADLKAMSEHLSQYGFSVDYLAQVQDHRLFPYIRDNMLRERRVREALAKVRNGKPGKAATSKPQKKAPAKGSDLANVKRGSHPNRLAAVFSNVD